MCTNSLDITKVFTFTVKDDRSMAIEKKKTEQAASIKKRGGITTHLNFFLRVHYNVTSYEKKKCGTDEVLLNTAAEASPR